MTHKSIKPATMDERGQISDILYKSTFQHAAIIESKCGGLIRGNHYHKQTTQHIFITSGALRYWYQPFDKHDEVKSVLVQKYDLVSTPPFEVHALEILEPTQFVVFSDGVRGGDDYESDTFRVPPILTPDMVRGA
jgi:dTDP-4-dehydrorhamnose 3,5-epimerase-like enzyme